MKTAVQYIENCIDKYLAYSVEGSHKAEPFTINDLLEALQQAKEMEKQQIMNSHTHGRNVERGINDGIFTAEQYYNEITKKLE